MYARKFLAGLGASVAALSVLALAAAPANAAYVADPDDTANHAPTATDLVGVGSDTIQGVDARVADAFNATTPASQVISYAATGTGDTPMDSGPNLPRVVGSGAGKSLLYGASNDTRVDFARSSSAENTNEVNAGLQSFPFAVDTLIMVKSGNVASHAPANLTVAQILSIYKGTVTNWSQVGGTAGTIKPLIPQSGSGTLSFFTAQLTAANGGTAVTFGPSVTPVTEHDPTPIKDDPDAIAPFSLAKKSTLANPAVVTTEPGFSADRAVYNVVRGTDLAPAAPNRAPILAAFGPTGYWCSPAAKVIIEAQGFRQLYPTTNYGVCGQQTQGAASNLITGQVDTTTTVTVTGATASSAKVVAKVSGSTVPFQGTVSVFEGATQVASNVPLISGQATTTVPAAPGSHTYKAVYTPGVANSPFNPSEGTGTGVVQKGTSTVSAHFKKKVTFGKKVKGKITVSLVGTSAQASGKVTITDGKKVVGTGTLANGKVKITLNKKLKPGKHKLTVEWAGDANATGSQTTVKIKVLAKPKK